MSHHGSVSTRPSSMSDFELMLLSSIADRPVSEVCTAASS